MRKYQLLVFMFEPDMYEYFTYYSMTKTFK